MARVPAVGTGREDPARADFDHASMSSSNGRDFLDALLELGDALLELGARAHQRVSP